ncbi:MAG: hypothetical protein KFF73_06550 [Cyclobacteriaceae bacterium]|nr:hypothetical protein [Cyclobacteriaceae bacterium]
MKKHQIVRMIIPVFFLHLLACQTEEDVVMDVTSTEMDVADYLLDAEERIVTFNQRISDNRTNCSATSLEIPLVAWPGLDVGTFTVNNNNDNLVANFEMDPSGEWDLKLTQLLIVVKETRETPKKTFIKTRKYVYPVHHEKGTRSFTYLIPLSDLKLTNDKTDKCISVAGIARLDNGYFRFGKFAIAENTVSGQRHTWKSWLHEYCISDCIQKISIDCGMAWMDGLTYIYNTTETGYYDIFHSEMENKYIGLYVTDIGSGQRIEIGDVEILFWGASSEYDLYIEFRPFEGYDILDAQIYAGILDPSRGPEYFKNSVTFADQNSLVFKMKTDYEPVYLGIAATVCSENNNL